MKHVDPYSSAQRSSDCGYSGPEMECIGGLLASPVDILDHSRVPRNERIHAAQKPLDLLRRLIECSTLPGDFVLDPCCGSGSTLAAAKELSRTGLGIESDETFYNTAMSNVFTEKPSPIAELA